MANVSGQGTTWNLPNYAGELFTSDMITTPLMNMLGGMGRGKQTNNFEFPCSSEYDLPDAAQPEVTETESLTAPTATEIVRGQVTNVAQIFHQAVKISYEKLSNGGRMSGLNTAGQRNNVADEKAFQIQQSLKIIARNLEYTLLNGAYQKATSAAVANKTRGLIAATGLSGGTQVAVSGADLSETLMNQLLKEMFDAGAMFMEPVIITNAHQKQMLSDIYGYAPSDRNVGGVNIEQIETDFGKIGIMEPHRFMPAGSLLIADLAVVDLVFQPVPEKGNFFYEALSKTGASENGQIYGKAGVDHGPAFAHGLISGLATS